MMHVQVAEAWDGDPENSTEALVASVTTGEQAIILTNIMWQKLDEVSTGLHVLKLRQRLV